MYIVTLLLTVLDIAYIQLLITSCILTSCLPVFSSHSGKANMERDGLDLSGKSIRAVAMGKLYICSECTLMLLTRMHVHCNIVVDCT